jgi:hypothetical protein
LVADATIAVGYWFRCRDHLKGVTVSTSDGSTVMAWIGRALAPRWLVVADGPRDQYDAPEMQEIVCFRSISNFHFHYFDPFYSSE